jgi:hypothetical protein
MKTLEKHIIKLVCFIALFIAFKVNAQTVNFSGTWQLDKTRTSFKTSIRNMVGTLPEYVLSRALRIVQTSSSLIIDRTNLTPMLEEKHYIQQISFDGKSSQTLSATGNTEADSLDRKSNKTTLVIGITTTTPTGDPSFNVIETWSLADDGRTLVIDRQVEQHDGTIYEIKGYYNKQ